MNIQIFGTKKSADTRKAERFFKERGIKFQFIDLTEKGFSKGELRSVAQSVGGLDALIDNETKNRDLAALISCLVPEQKEEKLFEHPEIIKQPVVRNGKQASVGYVPDVWKSWQ
ncbi:MAG: arsenate reductase family protein [Clostridia bacterium]|nr:arsenate reductase family protein [Clostridia bacterium]